MISSAHNELSRHLRMFVSSLKHIMQMDKVMGLFQIWSSVTAERSAAMEAGRLFHWTQLGAIIMKGTCAVNKKVMRQTNLAFLPLRLIDLQRIWNKQLDLSQSRPSC